MQPMVKNSSIYGMDKKYLPAMELEPMRQQWRACLAKGRERVDTTALHRRVFEMQQHIACMHCTKRLSVLIELPHRGKRINK